jgi:hypothetical protein
LTAILGGLYDGADQADIFQAFAGRTDFGPFAAHRLQESDGLIEVGGAIFVELKLPSIKGSSPGIFLIASVSKAANRMNKVTV